MNIFGIGVHDAKLTKYGLAGMEYVKFPPEWYILVSVFIYYVP